MQKTLSLIDAKTHVILLSSISYYDAKPLVLEAEVLLKALHPKVTILRLGGLMGYNRIAGKYTAAKTAIVDSKTNYVHRDDVVDIIESIIEQKVEGEMLDIVAPLQSTKKRIFTQNAKQFGFEKTGFLEGLKAAKVLNPIKLCKVLDYRFIHRDVHNFWIGLS